MVFSPGLTTLEAASKYARPEVRPPNRPSAQQKSEPALRYDAGKPRFELIPPDALVEVAKVYTMGAEKYDVDNWVKGMSWRRVVGSMLRHTMSWLGGEDVDKESGVAHMAHVAWGALTLISYGKRGVGADDRVKVSAT